MNARPDSPLTPFTDEEREDFIEQLRSFGVNRTESREARRLAFALMAEVIKTRDPRRVRKMEVGRFGRSFE